VIFPVRPQKEIRSVPLSGRRVELSSNVAWFLRASMQQGSLLANLAARIGSISRNGFRPGDFETLGFYRAGEATAPPRPAAPCLSVSLD
jgi:hypothetical protein